MYKMLPIGNKSCVCGRIGGSLRAMEAAGRPARAIGTAHPNGIVSTSPPVAAGSISNLPLKPPIDFTCSLGSITWHWGN